MTPGRIVAGILVLVLVASAALVVYLRDDDATPQPAEPGAPLGDVLVEIDAVGGSNQAGDAALRREGDGTEIEIELGGESQSPTRPAYVRTGSCPPQSGGGDERPAGEILHRLEPVEGGDIDSPGRSVSTVAAPIDELRGNVIEIVASDRDESPIACGVIE